MDVNNESSEKKVLIFTSDLYQGGVAESTRKIIKLLSCSCKVTVCSYDSLPIEKAIPKSVKLYELNIPLSVGFRNKSLDRLKVKIFRYLCLPIALLKLLYIISKEKPDTVYSLTYIPNIINILCSKIIKYNCIVSERQDPREDLDENSLLAKSVKYLYPKATTIHVNSKDMIAAVQEFYKVPKEKVYNFDNFFFRDEIIHLSKEPLLSKRFNAKYKIVTSGRLSKQKGQWHLIPIISELVKADYDVELLILGDGELKKELEVLAQKYGVKDRIHLLGDVKNPHNYVKICDLFIFPSIWESFGNTLVEAMALGIPIASTVCRSGPAQIIEEGKFGLNLGVFPQYGNELDKNSLNKIVNDIKLILTVDNDAYSRKSLKGYSRFDADTLKAKVLKLLKSH